MTQKSKPAAVVAVFLVVLVAVSGCIKLTTSQKIFPDGVSETTITLDFSKLKSLSEQQGETQQQGLSSTPNCDNLSQSVQNNPDILDVKCELIDESKISIWMKQQLREPVFEAVQGIPFNTYKFMPSNSNQLFGNMQQDSLGGIQAPPPQDEENTDQNGATQDQEKFTQQLQQMVSLAFEFDYSLEMPGQVTKAEGGRIKDNKAEYNLLEMLALANQKKQIYVESQEINPVILMGGVGLLLVLGLITTVAALFFLFRKNPAKTQGVLQQQANSIPKQPQATTQQAPQTSIQIEKIVQVLLPSKDKFSAEEIETVLKEKKYSSEEIKEVLKRLGKN